MPWPAVVGRCQSLSSCCTQFRAGRLVVSNRELEGGKGERRSRAEGGGGAEQSRGGRRERTGRVGEQIAQRLSTQWLVQPALLTQTPRSPPCGSQPNPPPWWGAGGGPGGGAVQFMSRQPEAGRCWTVSALPPAALYRFRLQQHHPFPPCSLTLRPHARAIRSNTARPLHFSRSRSALPSPHFPPSHVTLSC